MLNIFFQNGMDNNYQTAKNSADLIKNNINQDVGLIINKTSGSEIGDLIEYLPNQLYLKDVLNGEVYQAIANNNNERNLVILHSAGNEDMIKATKYLATQNINLNNKIDFISVGSPQSRYNVQQAANGVNASLIGSYNNILDPVTNAKSWVAGTGTLFVGGLVYGIAAGAGSAATGTGLEAYFSAGLGAAAGGAAGFGPGLGLLKFQHPFEAYYNKNFKNLSSDINNWSKANLPNSITGK